MTISKEKLNEIANEVKLVESGKPSTSVNLDDKYRLTFNLLCTNEILIYIERVGQRGQWVSCAKRNEFAPCGNISRLLEIVQQYVNEEECFMKTSDYFGHVSIMMNLHQKCVICGKDEDFHIYDENETGKIFKNERTSFCKECATKFARKILEGIDF